MRLQTTLYYINAERLIALSSFIYHIIVTMTKQNKKEMTGTTITVFIIIGNLSLSNKIKQKIR